MDWKQGEWYVSGNRKMLERCELIWWGLDFLPTRIAYDAGTSEEGTNCMKNILLVNGAMKS